MIESSSEIARRLAARAIELCRHYFPNGKRVGNYWIVGDRFGARGRSLYVRLTGPFDGKGAAGKFRDASTGEHGDLLDIIASVCCLTDHRDTLDEARRFLGASRPDDSPIFKSNSDRTAAARRLFAASIPIVGTLAETYLRARGIDTSRDAAALRFHPRCYYRHDCTMPPEYWPCLIAAVANLSGEITGMQRTFLARDGSMKAPVPVPRKAMGVLAGNGVRFGEAEDVIAAGEGIETVMSVRSVAPSMPMVAAVSAQNLRALALPPTLKRLYILADRDDAGIGAAHGLKDRAVSQSIHAMIVMPSLGDFNDDLCKRGAAASRKALRCQMSEVDIGRFIANR
ncbi:MAG: toprim domain-containing protein [Parvularculaceae bacterium]